ncbi:MULTISPECIES: sugar ABC transporter ATP-binding protein [Pseudomonas]|uniref:sugar ABC transporter ATP-binding protein n=1 Tax=Pseudomonas TaxID=286 RepID=UPI00087613ED|nr:MULTISPECIES: sugar ABC transporter ATP-binding protein [Pseudomonas]UVM08734.1 sugar ABC transporter ATP-binding protein [Pseudomonas protegens]SCZ75676.1 putative xylitol transport system ATP-binding protein [Pseudomonas sp. NFPP17]SDA38908.1 putative xylitol transport system ATP-binding protein [Pseudomonas sp. NFPP15]SEK49741.1 putative xylitol transport system ATP-binding protein [Pseudomonas sp. NFPP18]SFA68465.1 putative xylitol transport system ATP-binding protein [Pseudomonas sp. N
MAPPLLLQAEHVAKAYAGVPALRDGRLALRAGSVHALCGGNGAGKSTFLSILMGITRRDTGSILLNGHAVQFDRPGEALAAGVAMITQELEPIPDMSVAENIWLGREPRRLGCIVDRKALHRRTRALLESLEFDVDAQSPMRDLSVAQVQLVEIAKAFSHDCQVMIMDEPTSAIGEHETQTLFRAIRRLTERGAGIIYVSHRLSELAQIADDYSIFRDGAFVESGRMADIDRAHLVRGIVGQELQRIDHKLGRECTTEVCLEVSQLSRHGEFHDISLQLRRGEILGIYGLMGSGRSEFLNCIYGLTTPDAGSVTLQGRPLAVGAPGATIRAGLSLVTEDRKDSGLVLGSSILSNIALSAYGQLSRWSLINARKEQALARDMVRRLQIKVSSLELPVESMSGGNQQKVVLAKCLSTAPVCLLCDEPTRGIDEGAKQEIYQLLDQFVRSGGAAIVVSSEAPELLHLSDRIAIFKGGRLVTISNDTALSQEALLSLAS